MEALHAACLSLPFLTALKRGFNNLNRAGRKDLHEK